MARCAMMVAALAVASVPGWARAADRNQPAVEMTVGPPEPENEFVVRSPGAAATARIDRDSVVGPNAQFTRYGNTLRGSIGCAAFEIDFTDQRVTGLIDGAPVNLHVRRHEVELEVQGLYAGELSHFHIDAETIRGHLGPIGFDFSLDGSYQGMSTSGGFPLPASISLPTTLTRRSAGELVATLALLLSLPSHQVTCGPPPPRWRLVPVSDLASPPPASPRAEALTHWRETNWASPLPGPSLLSPFRAESSPMSVSPTTMSAPAPTADHAYAGPAHGTAR
ncbi:MAG TPA: hypothetical protein VKN99_12585 [Polyangia bacterium]|nr:hypothetical protein [Polyangia bacterium]